MNKKNRGNEGLTLIELLITIAVIAIVAAISVPVITNVISSSRGNAADVMQVQVNSFIGKYLKAGQVTYTPGTKTFAGFVDLDGNGNYSGIDERIESLIVGSEFTVGALSPSVLPTTLQALPAGFIATINSAGGSGGSGGSTAAPIALYTLFASGTWHGNILLNTSSPTDHIEMRIANGGEQDIAFLAAMAEATSISLDSIPLTANIISYEVVLRDNANGFVDYLISIDSNLLGGNDANTVSLTFYK